MGETTTTKGNNMKKITIAEYLKDIDTEELIGMISETGSWGRVHLDIYKSCREDLDNSVFISSLGQTSKYITNELTYFINDDEYDLDEFKKAIITFEDCLPVWLLVELNSDLKTAKVALMEAIEEDFRRMGFDI